MVPQGAAESQSTPWGCLLVVPLQRALKVSSLARLCKGFSQSQNTMLNQTKNASTQSRGPLQSGQASYIARALHFDSSRCSLLVGIQVVSISLCTLFSHWYMYFLKQDTDREVL